MITVTYLQHMGDDLTVVNAARVSFGKKIKALGYAGVDGASLKPILHDRDIKLIKYLAKHRHMSPFGHCFASFHIKAPIFVARQLVKHKFLRWNEISRRYVDDDPEFYVPKDWRGKALDKKQGSSGVIDIDYDALPCFEYHALECYKDLLYLGVAPEQARMVLPQSTMTEWYWSGSLDAFSDMCNLRLKEDTQYETKLVATKIHEYMFDLFRESWQSLTGSLKIRPMTDDERQRGKEKNIANGRR